MPEESFGQYLKQQRELRQISLEEISNGTKISVRLLNALEEEDWDAMPAQVFIKGFIRSYAEYIGLDPSDTLLRYEATKLPETEAPTETELNIPKGYSGPLGLRSPIAFKIIIFALFILVVAGAVYLGLTHIDYISSVGKSVTNIFQSSSKKPPSLLNQNIVSPSSKQKIVHPNLNVTTVNTAPNNVKKSSQATSPPINTRGP